jgi:hypothetical protein
VKREVPHVSTAREPSVVIWTGATGSERVISESRRPSTTTVPASSAWTGSVACAETS